MTEELTQQEKKDKLGFLNAALFAREKVTVKLIDQNVISTKPTAIVGYCNLYGHRGFLNLRLLKEHQCIDKKCPYLDKYENSSFWKEKEKNKFCKKLHKQEKRYFADRERAMLKRAEELVKEYGYDIKITSIKRLTREGRPINYIFFVSNAMFNDAYYYREIALVLHEEFKNTFRFRRLKDFNGRYVMLDDYNRKGRYI